MNSQHHEAGQSPSFPRCAQQKPSSTDAALFRLLEFDEFFCSFPGFFIQEAPIAFYCFILVRRGMLQLSINGLTMSGETDSAFRIFPGDRLFIKSSDEINVSVLVFPEEFLQQNKFSSLMLRDFRLFNRQLSPQAIHLETAEISAIEKLAKRIFGEIADSEPGQSREFVSNMFLTLLFLFERIMRSRNLKTTAPNPDSLLLHAFTDKLEKHFEAQRSVEFYAKALHVTPRKLNQVVSAQYGCSVKKVIERRVVEGIKNRLRSTDLTLKEIGYEFGFNDPTNFNKYFKKFTRQTPAAYKTLGE